MYEYIEGETHFKDWIRINKEPYQVKSLIKALQFVKRFHCAIDIGAHIGLLSIPLSKLFCKVYSIEPDETNFEILKRNVERNDSKNIRLYNNALSNYTGSAPFFKLNHSGGGYLHPNGDKEVPVRIFSTLFENIKADFIKIDTQGTEFAILEGMIEYLKTYRPVIMAEITSEKERRHVKKLLASVQYKYVGAYKKDCVFKK